MASPRRILATGFFTLLATLAAAPARAHLVSAAVGDFYAGLLHPLTSAEHLLPMLALALLAGQCGKAAARAAIVLFPLALAAGILAGSGFPGPRASFYADALGTVGLGFAVMAAPRLGHGRPVAAVAALVMGLVLGWRGGGDFAASPAGWRFVPGVAATGLAVVAVVAAWLPRLAGGRTGAIRLAVGTIVVGAGLAMGLGLLGGAPVAAGLPRLPGEKELEALAGAAGRSPGLMAAALFGAFAWGAGHALTPGHGKALVGAYLVGSRGSPGQALALGAIVTLTHTLGVFLLGGAAWLASGSLDQGRLAPWLSLASGLGVAMIGGALCLSRWRGLGRGGAVPHSHGGLVHSHGGPAHGHGGRPLAHGHGGAGHDPTGAGWRSLAALGVSGGLVPCPGALVLLLGAVAVGRVGFGLLLVAAFSLGLALVLTAVGLLFLKGARFLEAVPSLGRAARLLPLVAALAVTGLGLVLTLQAAIGLVGR
ncbi:nickel/cobalt transporter [Solidesulfovibrio sp.]|uniref:nickel/cobalt transporter n=1 Tax=Solidesulfovibrio sp. TaxID=2910990 RepID=UPI002B211B40|nr:HupE/UreJ family protein [Solidesulfovibrio sp.]MEA4855483.1 HupE/UreJ family protein [Solidesulfovibrio sp.]